MKKKLLIILSVITFISFTSSATWAKQVKTPTKASSDPISTARCNQFTFDATGSHDPDNENINYLWDFGDGQTSTESVVNHIYEKSGDYNVTLTITDNSGKSCSTAVTSQLVRANIKPHADLTVPEAACTNQDVRVDASNSFSENKNLNYRWDLGDGSKVLNQKKISKIYTQGGDYRISVTVDDNNQTSCSTDTSEKVIHVNEPPIAEAGAETVLKCVSDDQDMDVAFDASQSRDNNNDQLTYLWDFGDGSKGQGIQASHRYAQLGNYDAKLIVKDNTSLGCGTGVDFVTVRIAEAPRAEAGDDLMICSGEPVAFDGSKSYSNKKGILTYQWFFGDGVTATGLKASHAYDRPGKYQATLAVQNELNSMCPPSKDIRNITVNTPPTLNALEAEKTACVGTKLNFDASTATDADGDALEYYWSFGDGSVLRAGPKVSHEYKQGGQYRVSVIVDDGKGTACSTATVMASLKINTPPIADAGVNSTCCVDTQTTFDAQASSDPDGDQLTYTWDFGDGTKFTGIDAQHAYSKSGSYNVTLIIDDNSGTACSKSQAGFIATVNSSPVAVINVR